MIIAAVAAVTLTVLFLLCTRPLLGIMNTGAEILEDAATYLTIISAGIGATVLYNMLSAIMRAVGNSRAPLVFLVLSALLNIGLDFLCILVFRWGVAGAAIADGNSAADIGALMSWIYCEKSSYSSFKKGKLLYFFKRDCRTVKAWNPHGVSVRSNRFRYDYTPGGA